MAGGGVGRRDPDAHARVYLLSIKLEGLSERTLNGLRDGPRMTGIRTVVNHDDELVTAKVRQRALVTDHVTQTVGDRLEQLVTARVAQAAVDRPQSVDVEDQNGGRVDRLGASEPRPETLFDTRPPAVRCQCHLCHRFPTLSVSSAERHLDIRAADRGALVW